MEKEEVLAFAKTIAELDTKECADIFHSLMRTRKLSKVVRGLDNLAKDGNHQSVAQTALKKLGFDPE